MVLREHRNGPNIPIISPISKAAYFLAQLPINLKKMFNPEVYDPGKAREDRFEGQYGFNGEPNISEQYLLLGRFDGDLKTSVVELVNLKSFDVLHVWKPDINSILENVEINENGKWEFLFRDKKKDRFRMIHPILHGDGSLIFADGSPLIKIDRNSNLEQIVHDEKYHHSIEKDEEGNFWTCVTYYPFKTDSLYVGNAKYDEFQDDGIRKISPNAEILFDKSISEIFIENGMKYLLFSIGDRQFTKNPIHLNDIQPVKKDTKYWKKGDLFLSLRHQSMVLLYRPITNKIIWKSTGKFFHQHDVDILDDSRISIFNNNSIDTYSGNIVDGSNNVIIYDFKTDKYSYYLEKSMEKENIRTLTQGRSQILPNGDLFIEETNYGRTMYFNANGSLRWSHINRAGNGRLYISNWSRILYEEEDLKIARQFK